MAPVAAILHTVASTGVCANQPGTPAEGQGTGQGRVLSSAVKWERTGCQENRLELRGRVVWTQPSPSGPRDAPASVLTPPLAYQRLPVDSCPSFDRTSPAAHRYLGPGVCTLGPAGRWPLAASSVALVLEDKHTHTQFSRLAWTFPAGELP